MIDHRPTVHATPKVPARDDLWWRGAIIYQIYPRSFQDSNGDGVGDLAGIVQRMDYIASLHVDVIWISPFFKSPMKDFGYDVEDYCDVDPVFGTLDDFDRVTEAAHKHGIRVMIDFVPSHTSDRHAWFVESRSNAENDKADWYVWADAKEDGSPPNNWISIFGGSAWQWEPRRGQYYLHNFLAEQPDMNFNNEDAVGGLLGQARFWFERGVDGFRVDAIDFGVHNPDLDDNPPRKVTRNRGATPYDMQYQVNNKASPKLSDLFLKPLWRLSAEFDSKALLGEISGDYALERTAEYTEGGGLDISYTFDLLTCEPRASVIREIVARLEQHIGQGWACWSLSNHDVMRSATQFGGDAVDARVGRFIPVLLGCLRGTICIYQGEELGLPEAKLAYEQFVDPVGIRFYPDNPGRDGCRTPMPWDDQATHLGFSEADPWLPMAATHKAFCVNLQETDDHSPLNHTRRFFAWRRAHRALIDGDIEFAETSDPILAFKRVADDQQLWCFFNVGPDPVSVSLDAAYRLTNSPSNCGHITDATLHLEGWGSVIMTK